jgi:polyhydroxyalkanoate synthesis regulator phasin
VCELYIGTVCPRPLLEGQELVQAELLGEAGRFAVKPTPLARRFTVFRYLLPMVLGLSVLILGCKKQEPPQVTAKEVEKKVAEATGAAADYAKREKDEYVARAQGAVDEAKAEIAELKARAKEARGGAKTKLERQIEAIEGRWKLAERKLGELKSATGEAWKDLRSGVDKAVEDVKHSSAKKGPGASSAAR